LNGKPAIPSPIGEVRMGVKGHEVKPSVLFRWIQKVGFPDAGVRHDGKLWTVKFVTTFVNTFFVSMFPAQLATIVSAHLAGKAIFTRMFFVSSQIRLRHINFSFYAWNFYIFHMGTFSTS
jgi:hypothetical protein